MRVNNISLLSYPPCATPPAPVITDFWPQLLKMDSVTCTLVLHWHVEPKTSHKIVNGPAWHVAAQLLTAQPCKCSALCSVWLSKPGFFSHDFKFCRTPFEKPWFGEFLKTISAKIQAVYQRIEKKQRKKMTKLRKNNSEKSVYMVIFAMYCKYELFYNYISYSVIGW